MKQKIGVTITTHNRRAVFEGSLTRWRGLMPAGAELVVVDDGSDEPVRADGATIIRHEYPKGVAAAKNAGIAALIDLNVDHLFLADDDTYPVTDNWWQPYVRSPEPHLSYQWTRPGRNSRWRETHNDGTHWSITYPRGVLLYLHRGVVDAVGGMATHHGAHGGEHADWSHRIHQAGLTTWPFADVVGSGDLWHSVDQHQGNTSGSSRFDVRERRRMCHANEAHRDRRWPGWPFFPYREHATMQDYQPGPRLADTHEGTLDHVLMLRPFGLAAEFGVGEGHSLCRIAAHMPAVGFDNWNGLPEDWRPGFPAGTFACDPPNVPNTTLVKGMFADTLPTFDFPAPVGLWHIDCDLHSSTATVLQHIEPHLLPGAYIVFDEYHGYDGHQDHEAKAWREFADRTGIGWTVVGHGPEQWAIRLL